jgi:hypothetical protein
MTTPVKIYNTTITANIDAEIIKDLKEKYPKVEVTVCFDEECELSKLEKGESACYGDGVNFYFILKDTI